MGFHASEPCKHHDLNYPTHDLALISVHALKMWRHYLLGKGFELGSEYDNL